MSTSPNDQQNIIIVSVILGIILIGVFWSIASNLSKAPQKKMEQSKSQPSAEQSKSTKSQEVTEVQGTYTDINGIEYHYYIGSKDGRHAAIFQPILPRSDAHVIGALYSLIDTTYGKDTITNPMPRVDSRNGINYLTLEYNGGHYYFLLNKEDSGEANSISYWKE